MMFETATLSIFKDIKVHMKINNCIDLFNANANYINSVCVPWMFNFKQLTDIQLRACFLSIVSRDRLGISDRRNN